MSRSHAIFWSFLIFFTRTMAAAQPPAPVKHSLNSPEGMAIHKRMMQMRANQQQFQKQQVKMPTAESEKKKTQIKQ